MGRLQVLEDILALDALSLREPDGGPLDLAAHRRQLEKSAITSRFATVERGGALIAYGYIWPLGERRWFVGGFSIHPDHRNAGVVAELFRTFADIVKDSDAVELHSHVLANNVQSLRLHKRLGFKDTQRNDRAIAFMAYVNNLQTSPFLRSSNTKTA
jgi:RimJ/RimL family protein N-acetyltransferase